ncbi:MAG: formylmethanofuran dehydrogenase subunit B [Planctomycetales bacterium]|nr:formylmethanofuran dehydrogenase subunit B [Planctomycetales bacterium]
MPATLENREFHDIACTLCGCVCDDLRVSVCGQSVTAIEPPCPLADPWFQSLGKCQPPVASIEGHATTLEAATATAAKILSTARAPLIYGLSRSSTPGQRAAVRLADRLQAYIDTTASQCHAPSIMAIQEVGESTCSLGEVKNRSDLVIFWKADPLTSHPRHLQRYSGEAAGMFISGREDRTIVVIDERETSTARSADLFLPINGELDFEAIWTLRCLVQGQPIASENSVGIPLDPLRDLANRMTTCRYGVVFFGLGLARARTGHRNVEALLRLVTDVNAHARFSAKRMRIPGDVTGADSVLCWQTGFPFSVNLSRGYPRFNPGEYSANDLLERGEVDACLLVGAEGVADFSPKAQAQLQTIPVVALDYPTQSPLPTTAVQFTTAIYGVHRPGTAYRMDEVPIPLRAFLPSDYPADHEVLALINAAVESQATGIAAN